MGIPYHDAVIKETPLRVLVTAGNVALDKTFGCEFSVGWLRSEVMEWLRSLPPVELNGLDAVQRRRRAQKLEACEGTSRRSR